MQSSPASGAAATPQHAEALVEPKAKDWSTSGTVTGLKLLRPKKLPVKNQPIKCYWSMIRYHAFVDVLPFSPVLTKFLLVIIEFGLGGLDQPLSMSDPGQRDCSQACNILE